MNKFTAVKADRRILFNKHHWSNIKNIPNNTWKDRTRKNERPRERMNNHEIIKKKRQITIMCIRIRQMNFLVKSFSFQNLLLLIILNEFPGLIRQRAENLRLSKEIFTNFFLITSSRNKPFYWIHSLYRPNLHSFGYS